MMKKTILIIIFELIFSGISHSQTIEIVEHLNNKSLNNNANYFECKESISPFENEIAKVDFSIKGDTIYVENFSDNGFSGVKISFEINSDMKISQMEFYAWDNLKNEIKNKISKKNKSRSNFTIEKFILHLYR